MRHASVTAGNCKGRSRPASLAPTARPVPALLLAALFLAGTILAASPAIPAQAPAQSTFSSPEEALQALVTATTARDRNALAALFGPDYRQLLSGDDVEDTNDLEDFAGAVSESVQLQKAGDSKFVVTAGKNNYPLPIPIVLEDGRWRFDTKAGLEEILNRRIGENEFSAISTCRAYAIAQWEYFTEGDWDNDGVAEYAQRLISSPGTRNGLYWETGEGEKPSPLGQLVAAARAEGYGPKANSPAGSGKPDGTASMTSGDAAAKPATANEGTPRRRAPYHGYIFKILKSQGPHAPGGKYSYVINGNMIAGYALVAYPAKWGNSGVMTFIINQQGRVYEKNLGPDTEQIASGIAQYDPDTTWKFVEVQP